MKFADFSKKPATSDGKLKGFGSFGKTEEAGPPEPGPKENFIDAVMEAGKVGQEIVQPPTAEAIQQSPVGKALAPLNLPTNFATGRMVGFAELLKPGIKQALNPQDLWFPDIAPVDVLNFYTPTPADMEGKALAAGAGPWTAAAVREAYRFGRLGVGLAASFYLDPLRKVQVGQRTQLGEEAYKAGRFDDVTHNLVQVNAPFSQKPMVAVPAAPVKAGIQRAAGAARAGIEKIPGGKGAIAVGAKGADLVKDFISSLDYRTGDPEIDLAASKHAGLKRGDQQFILERFYQPLAAKKFSAGENGLLSHGIENSPNLAPELPASVLQAAPNLGKDAATVEKQLRAAIQKRALELNAPLPDGRLDDLVEAGMIIKRENAIDLIERGKAGLIQAEDLATSVIENYLVHKKSPLAEKYAADPRKAAALEEAKLVREVMKTTRGSYLSDFDTGKIGRTIRTPLEEANQIMKERTGITDWFITDPIIATAMKRAETRKLVRDSELLDIVAKKGVRPKTALEARQLKSAGYEPIPHPKFEGKTIIIRGEDGVQKVKFKDLLFPKEIAGKMSYYITPREVGSISGWLDSYNRLFRSTALFKPDYHIENVMENMLKNWAQGVKMEDYADVAKIVSGKGTIKIQGREIPAAEVGQMLKDWGIHTGGQFKEGIEGALFTAKKLNAEKSLLKKGYRMGAKQIGNLFSAMGWLGTKFENQTRSALFLNRLKQGYKPEMAAFEVEKFLFDFSRTSKGLDIARRFYNPFVQAAVKTGFAAPAMLGKSPAVWNLYENNLMQAMERAIHDPVTASQLRELFPEYYRVQDRIAGPLLPGNHWLAILAGAEKQRLPMVMALGLPGGMNILNQFAIWDEEVARNSLGGAPLLRSFGMMLTGTDPFTGKDIDIMKGSPDIARRLNAAIRTYSSGAIALPNVKKWLEHSLGLGNPDFFDGPAVLALHGSLGKFGKMTNLDREYLFRMMAMASARRSLITTLYRSAAAEAQGKTADILYSDKPTIRAALNWATKPTSSAEVFDKLMGEVTRARRAQVAAGSLAGEIKPAEIVGLIKNIDQTAKDLSKNYTVMMENYFRLAKDMKAEQLELLNQQMSHQLEQTVDAAIGQ